MHTAIRGLAGTLAWALAAPALAQAPAFFEDEERGMDARLLVGVQAFPGAASDLVGAGLAYGIAVALRPWPALAIELGYHGANFETVAAVDADEVSIFENGAQLLGRAALRFDRLEPYAFAGGALASIDVVEEDIRSSVTDDWLVKLPLGIGADYHLGALDSTHLILGARASYAFVFDDDFVQVTGRGADQLAVLASAGAHF